MPGDLPTTSVGDPGEPSSALPLPDGVRVTSDAVRFQFSRSSGPGGQNVNKVNTRAELWVDLAGLSGLSPAAMQRLRHLARSHLTSRDEIHLTDSQTASQEQNRLAVIEKLQSLIEAAMAEPKHRRRTRPTAASKKRRLDAKKIIGQRKALRRDYGD